MTARDGPPSGERATNNERDPRTCVEPRWKFRLGPVQVLDFPGSRAADLRPHHHVRSAPVRPGSRGIALRRELQAVERGVDAAELHQLLVIALLAQLAVVEHQNAVRATDGR